MTPLSLVVLVSMVKDIFEDRKRYIKDTEENQSPCYCIKRGGNTFDQAKT